MFKVERFEIETLCGEATDLKVKLFNAEGEELVVAFQGDITYPSKYGPEHDLTLALSEDFLAHIAASLGYEVEAHKS